MKALSSLFDVEFSFARQCIPCTDRGAKWRRICDHAQNWRRCGTIRDFLAFVALASACLFEKQREVHFAISEIFQWCFPFFLAQISPPLQESRSTQQECRLGVAASVGGGVDPLLRQTHATFPRMRSIWFRECGQDLWTVCKGVVYTSNSHEQTQVEAAEVRTWQEAVS